MQNDLISRTALMKKIAHHTVHDSMMHITFERATIYEMVKGDMFGLVKKAPVVDSMPRWISVEERLPENYEDVNVFVVGDDGSWFINTGYYDGTHWRAFSSTRRDKVTHWMPLPSTEGLHDN